MIDTRDKTTIDDTNKSDDILDRQRDETKRELPPVASMELIEPKVEALAIKDDATNSLKSRINRLLRGAELGNLTYNSAPKRRRHSDLYMLAREDEEDESIDEGYESDGIEEYDTCYSDEDCESGEICACANVTCLIDDEDRIDEDRAEIDRVSRAFHEKIDKTSSVTTSNATKIKPYISSSITQLEAATLDGMQGGQGSGATRDAEARGADTKSPRHAGLGGQTETARLADASRAMMPKEADSWQAGEQISWQNSAKQADEQSDRQGVYPSKASEQSQQTHTRQQIHQTGQTSEQSPKEASHQNHQPSQQSSPKQASELSEQSHQPHQTHQSIQERQPSTSYQTGEQNAPSQPQKDAKSTKEPQRDTKNASKQSYQGGKGGKKASEHTPQREKLHKNGYIFYTSLAITLFFAIWGLLSPHGLITTLWALVYDFHYTFNWFVISAPLFFVTVLLVLAFSRYGDIKLGDKDSEPEFSTFSWISMLFTAGIGVGLVDFGVSEPLVHYLHSPLGVANGYSPVEAAKNALMLTMYNWGIPAWAIFSISGLVIAYFAYHKKAPFLPGSPIEYGFADMGWGRSVGACSNILATSAAALTVAASIGLGTFQVRNGINAIFDIHLSGLAPLYAILAVLFLSYTIPALLSLRRGMKFLGNFNVLLAIALLVFVFAFGPTRYLMEMIVETIGRDITSLLPIGTNTYPFEAKGWFNDWPLTTLVWWVSWTPFAGVFIARISKGRTIRSFALGALIIPTVFLTFWFSVFGGLGLLNAVLGDGSIAKYVADNPDNIYYSFIMVLHELPLFKLTGVVFIVLIFAFLSTTATSSALSLSIMTGKSRINPSRSITLIWCVIMVMIASANVAVGTLNGVKAVAVFLGLPYFLFLILQVSGFLRALYNEHGGGALLRLEGASKGAGGAT